MTVKVTERDDSHKSHEGVAAGIRIWDVHQQDLLVGMFHSEIAEFCECYALKREQAPSPQVSFDSRHS